MLLIFQIIFTRNIMNNNCFKEHRKSGNNTPVLFYFLSNEKEMLAKCKQCSRIIKVAGGSTSGLHTHLKTQHKINLLKRKKICVNRANTSSSSSALGLTSPNIFKITNYLISNNDSLAAVLSRMTALDGLPFSVFCTSTDLWKALIARGFKELPKSANSIKKTVIEYSKSIRAFLTNELVELKRNGERFSLTFDEWTSTSNRRYLNVNVHSEKKIWNLGVTQVSGSMPAEICVEIVDFKLKQYGLSLKTDIVCITTDGASVMKKFGKLIDVNQQLCYAHGVQLGVISVLYQQKQDQEKQNTLDLDSSDSEFGDSDDEDYKNSSSSGENSLIGLEIDNDNDISLTYQGLLPVIIKIRKVVRLFRRSPTKNAVLQKFVQAEIVNKELLLILDSKTCWNSLLLMMERFMKLKNPIQKALIDINSPIHFSDREFNSISTTISSLLPIKLAVEALCRQDANLLTANATIEFMLESLNKQKSPLSEELYRSLKYRMKERQIDLEKVLRYLHDPNEFNNENEKENNREQLTRTNLAKIIFSLNKRLYETQHTIEGDFDKSVTELVNLEENVESEEETLSLKEKLQRAINKKIVVNPAKPMVPQKDLLKIIKREMVLFEEERTRGKYLEQVYCSLLTIPPTSVESERAFSATDKICTKIRSRLSDESIDALCFLRSHFKNI